MEENREEQIQRKKNLKDAELNADKEFIKVWQERMKEMVRLL